MANSLHFERDRPPSFGSFGVTCARPGDSSSSNTGTYHGNPHVPHPLAFASWAVLAAEAGFRDTRRLASVPSRFLGSIYSAVSVA